MLFFSKIIVNVSVKTISVIKKVLLYILKTISYPFNIIGNIFYKFLIKPVIQIFTRIKEICIKILKNTNKHGKIIQNKEGI